MDLKNIIHDLDKKVMNYLSNNYEVILDINVIQKNSGGKNKPKDVLWSKQIILDTDTIAEYFGTTSKKIKKAEKKLSKTVKKVKKSFK